MLVTAPSLGLERCDGIAIGRERMTAITRRMGIEAAAVGRRLIAVRYFLDCSRWKE
jgi:hypothetical protein